MEPFTITTAVWLAAGGFGLAGLLRVRAIWRRRAAPPAASVAPPAVTPEALLHRIELRMEAIEGLQAGLAARLEALDADDAAERRLQAMAGQILGLVRDKDASLEVALAGLDQLRARMRMLEQLGDAAEARALFERLGARIDAAETDQARTATTLAARLAVIEGTETPYAEISGQLTRLCAQKDATLETVFARLAPLEAKLAELERAGAADDGVEAARAEAQAIAVQLIAARTVAEETRLFASRIGLLEASLPRLSLAQALMMQALERQAAPASAGWPLADAEPAGAAVPEVVPLPAPTPAAAPDPAAAEAEDALWRLPRVISVHAG